MVPSMLNLLGACAYGMHIYSILAHVLYHFKLSIACVVQSNIVAAISLAIHLRLSPTDPFFLSFGCFST